MRTQSKAVEYFQVSAVVIRISDKNTRFKFIMKSTLVYRYCTG